MKITLGIGCRKHCSADEIVTLIRSALKECGMAVSDVSVIASAWMKADEGGIARAAATLGLPLVFISKSYLEAVADLALTRSEHVMSLHGVPSVAETSALAAAGKNPRLIRPRQVSAQAACAIACGEAA